MQVSVESFGALGRRLTVAVPADRVEKEFSTRLQRLSKQVKMPGFRPGKVPLKMVEAQYGVRLMDEVAGALIQTTLREAIGSQGLRPAGDPRVQRKPMARGEQLEYTVEFEILPEIKRFDLADLFVERPVVAVTDEDVNRTLETIRHQRAPWKPVDRAAQLGDRVLINFIGRLNGKEFDGGKADGIPVVLGSGMLIEDMEQGLVGVRTGEGKKISASFPTNYRNAQLSGQTAEFDVTVIEVTEKDLPELDDSFAATLGVQEGGLAKMRADVRANLEREAVTRGRAVVKQQVLRGLLKAHPIEVPKSLLEAEIQRTKSAKAASPGGNPGELNEQQARDRVMLGLILSEYIRQRGIDPDPAAVRAKLEEIAIDYESPSEFVRWHYEKPERLSGIESLILEDKVVDELLKTVKVTDKTMSFQELLNMASATP